MKKTESGSRTVRLTLENGCQIEVAPVPPFFIAQVMGVLESRDSRLRLPSPPVEEIAGVAGVERVAARPGTPEWEEWRQKRWEVEQLRERERLIAVWDVGILRWQRPGEEWQDQPPADWQMPERYANYLGQPSSPQERRCWYIWLELVCTAEDIRQVGDVLMEAGPLEAGEVAAAENLFPPP